jgi:multidrug efflux pump subunit AcrA (membrane-fusion protein)
MFRIARVDPLRVEIIIPAALFGTVTNGMLAVVTPDIPDAKSLRARVILVDKMIDPASNTFRVRAELPNANRAIPPGLRCRAILQTGGEQVQATPRPAVSNEVPAKVRTASFKLDSGLKMTNGLTMTDKPKKTVEPKKASESKKTIQRSSAHISSH